MLIALQNMTIFGVLMVMVGASLAALIFARRLRDPNQQTLGTGAKLCRKMELSLTDRGMLLSIADYSNLPGIVPILISRGCFDYAVSNYSPRGADAHQIRAIRKKLFLTSSTVKK